MFLLFSFTVYSPNSRVIFSLKHKTDHSMCWFKPLLAFSPQAESSPNSPAGLGLSPCSAAAPSQGSSLLSCPFSTKCRWPFYSGNVSCSFSLQVLCMCHSLSLEGLYPPVLCMAPSYFIQISAQIPPPWTEPTMVIPPLSPSPLPHCCVFL